MTDREQTRRDAEEPPVVMAIDTDSHGNKYPTVQLLGDPDAVRAVMQLKERAEQSERERDEARESQRNWHQAYFAEHGKLLGAEARLAKVPALVEALREIDSFHDVTAANYPNGTVRDVTRAALATWEQE